METIINILKELIGIQINSDVVILNLKWAILLPIIFIQLWLCTRTFKSYLPKKWR